MYYGNKPMPSRPEVNSTCTAPPAEADNFDTLVCATIEHLNETSEILRAVAQRMTTKIPFPPETPAPCKEPIEPYTLENQLKRARNYAYDVKELMREVAKFL